ncbi:cyclic pyranopterin monophosphate synthase MoaC [Mechercharimyces sp. CAU 1602]|uniref:cyclic pyranopterin monophosphate synthase MoaC n=1 Tax=Mechercharimyces sp. CAU 1602 TaxID=2973933 RepID=UPI002162D1CB|nr:cyclic pyranopterin monophosphate synthase MoaC [Mechercharimyces sp. CAU 1602]MCS1350091.1 cyclic pyranopterin monophosphate synthase MoaC [Mechercharimyces sp. CAU 1602]
MNETDLTHFNEQHRSKMVDVTSKPSSLRIAIALSRVQMKERTLARIREGDVSKGDVLSVAQTAGILAAKRTADLIPMCHPLFISSVDIHFSYMKENTLGIRSTVKTQGVTGVEMEALTAASVAALTIYDMCKAIDKEMVIGPTYVLEKKGGKSGDFKIETNDDREGSLSEKEEIKWN